MQRGFHGEGLQVTTFSSSSRLDLNFIPDGTKVRTFVCLQV